MLDKNLMIEHTLRDHVREQRDRVEKHTEAVIDSQYGRGITITYDADDGGMWKIGHYHNKISTSATGAELALVADAFCVALSANHGNRALRGLIAAPSSQDTEQF